MITMMSFTNAAYEIVLFPGLQMTTAPKIEMNKFLISL